MHGDSASRGPFRRFDAPFADQRVGPATALHVRRGLLLLVGDGKLDGVVRCDDVAHELALRVERAVISARGRSIVAAASCTSMHGSSFRLLVRRSRGLVGLSHSVPIGELCGEGGSI